MKILIVCAKLNGGGAERVGVMLANGLAKRGHNVSMLSNLMVPVVYHVSETVGLSNLVSTNNNKFVKWYSAIKNVRKNIKKEKPDVIIGIMGLCTLISYIACIGFKIPIVMTEHNSFERPASAPMPLYLKVLKFYCNKLYKHITVLTEADKKAIGNRLKGITVMPNPLQLTPVSKIPIKEKVILAAGRLDSWHYKGLDLLIKAWGKLNNENGKMTPFDKGWTLQIAGTGSKKSQDYLKDLCREYDVEKSVKFLGFRNDIEDLYKKTEIFVLSSRYEGFGLVLIEAMSQGCACVACDYKGRQREIIIDDSIGLCCEPENIDLLAKSIGRMVSDDEYRKQVQVKAVERSKYYSIDNIATKWELYLTSIVK